VPAAPRVADKERLAAEAAAAAATSEEFYAEMAACNVAPLWDRYNQLAPPEPAPRDRGMQWRWSQLKPLIDRACREVSVELAERRVLMLINPGFNGLITSTTGLYGAIQVLMPGEAARPHRHTASAFRFVLEGQGGCTTVNGKPCVMNEGDLILTPNWAWHDHTNPGSDRVVWFDGLDVPVTMFYNAWFGEDRFEGAYPETEASLPDAAHAGGGLRPVTGLPSPPCSPRIRYAREDVDAVLDAMPAAADGSRLVRYTNPVDGGAVTPTMDLYMLRLAASAATCAKRTTHNTVGVVARGSGHSMLGDRRIEWSRGDVVTFPHWTWTTHCADAGGAELFLLTDRDLVTRLGLLREEYDGLTQGASQ
jgi:gentisate 1,2-dioxygenase